MLFLKKVLEFRPSRKLGTVCVPTLVSLPGENFALKWVSIKTATATCYCGVFSLILGVRACFYEVIFTGEVRSPAKI